MSAVAPTMIPPERVAFCMSSAANLLSGLAGYVVPSQ